MNLTFFEFTGVLNMRPFYLVLHVSISCSCDSSRIGCMCCFHDLVSCLSVRLTEAHTCATWSSGAIRQSALGFSIGSRGGGGGWGEGGGADLDMAEDFVEKDDQAQAVHPHKVVEVIIVFFHLRSGTCLVDLMQTWDSVSNACFYHAQV